LTQKIPQLADYSYAKMKDQILVNAITGKIALSDGAPGAKAAPMTRSQSCSISAARRSSHERIRKPAGDRQSFADSLSGIDKLQSGLSYRLFGPAIKARGEGPGREGLP
jgi:hypothetical protein